MTPLSIEQHFFDVAEPGAGKRQHVLVTALDAGRQDVGKLRRRGFDALPLKNARRSIAIANDQQRQWRSFMPAVRESLCRR